MIFFDDPSEETDGSMKDYPKALFKCTTSQATYVSKSGVSRDVVYDAVIRSAVTAGDDSVFGRQDHKTKTKEVTGPVVRQQLHTCM